MPSCLRVRFTNFLMLGISSVGLFSGSAHAQEVAASVESSGLEEILVTAQRRSENLQNTPIAITAYTSAALEAQGIMNVIGVMQATPGLYSAPYPGSATTLGLFMRGQGIGDANLITKDGGVALYVDGVYQSRPQNATFDLADVERVEVLRGPQGTLYGRNTTGGAVNIISKKPTGEFSLDGLLSAGNYGYRRALLNADLPEFAGLKIKLTGLLSNLDGWSKNARDTNGTPAANDFATDRKAAGRAAVRWEPATNFTADYSVDYSDVRTTPQRYVNEASFMPFLFPGYSADPRQTYRSVYLPYSHVKSYGHTLIAEFRPSSELTLRSLTGFRRIKMDSYQDYVEAFIRPFYTHDRLWSETWTQELQAVGQIGSELKYTAGAFYFDERARINRISDQQAGSAVSL